VEEREKRCEAQRGQRETALVMATGFMKIEGQWANSSTKIQVAPVLMSKIGFHQKQENSHHLFTCNLTSTFNSSAQRRS